MPTSIRKVVVASFIGTTIEWYDYFIFVTAASLIFPDVFFPGFGETAGKILSYTTFAVGFVARPVGGVIFGHYGDRIGRKAMLVTTLLIMGIATFLVGCLPGYGAIGVLAPILLVALRLFRALAWAESGAARCSWPSSTPLNVAAASTRAGRRWGCQRASC